MYEGYGLFSEACTKDIGLGTRRGQYGTRVHRGELCSALTVSTGHHKLLCSFNVPIRSFWAVSGPIDPFSATKSFVMLGLIGLRSVKTPVRESPLRRPITIAVLTLPSASRWDPHEAIKVRIGARTGGDHSEEVSGMLSGAVEGPWVAVIRIVIYSGWVWPLGAAGRVDSPEPPAEVS